MRKKKQIVLREEELRQQRSRAQSPEKPSLLARMLLTVRRGGGAQALEQTIVTLREAVRFLTHSCPVKRQGSISGLKRCTRLSSLNRERGTSAPCTVFWPLLRRSCSLGCNVLREFRVLKVLPTSRVSAPGSPCSASRAADNLVATMRKCAGR